MTLRLNGSTSGYTEIDAPAVAGSNTLVLPGGNGSAYQVLTTNGSGVLSWGAGSKILQVVSATKTDNFSTSSSGAFVDVTGLSVSLTPRSSSSTVLILANLFVGDTTTGNFTLAQIVRNSTVLGSNTSSGGGFNCFTTSSSLLSNTGRSITHGGLSLLDSPATTSSVTYKVQCRVDAGTGYVNRWSLNTDAVGSSSITVMEVAA